MKKFQKKFFEGLEDLDCKDFCPPLPQVGIPKIFAFKTFKIFRRIKTYLD